MIIDTKDYLAHHGIAGQKWGVRRYQNEDGSLTPEGREHYGYSMNERGAKKLVKDISKQSKNGFFEDKDSTGHKLTNDYANELDVLKNKNASMSEKNDAMNKILSDSRMSKIAENASIDKQNKKVNNIITASGAAGATAGVLTTVAGVANILGSANWGSGTFNETQLAIGKALSVAGAATTVAGTAATTYGTVKSAVDSIKRTKRIKD